MIGEVGTALQDFAGRIENEESAFTAARMEFNARPIEDAYDAAVPERGKRGVRALLTVQRKCGKLLEPA